VLYAPSLFIKKYKSEEFKKHDPTDFLERESKEDIMNQTYLTVKDLPVSERPYEKCEKYGAGALSDAELLAVILRTGTKKLRAIDLAVDVLNYSPSHPGLKGLNYLTLKELTRIKGIGRVKAIELLCLTELTKRMAKEIHKDSLKLVTPQSVANYYMQDMRHLTREQVKLLMMDSKNKIIKDITISAGTVNTSLMPIREIFVQAFKYEAVNIIVLHNHPSGDPAPSSEDIRVTKRLADAGKLIGITLMDHIIIGDNRYISLKEHGYF
jgi:DNA repair protein RadC